MFLLGLLEAFGCDVPVQVPIRAAALFDIDESRTRVALRALVLQRGLALRQAPTLEAR